MLDSFLWGSHFKLYFKPHLGGKIDKIGFRKSSVIAAVSLAAFSSLIVFSTGPITLGIFWALAGGAVGCMSVALQALGATAILIIEVEDYLLFSHSDFLEWGFGR